MSENLLPQRIDVEDSPFYSLKVLLLVLRIGLSLAG